VDSNTNKQQKDEPQEKTLTARELYQLDLQKQIELKRLRKEQEQREQLEWERKKDLEMMEFKWGGGGGNGAPIRDERTGKIISNLRVLGKDLVTINRDKIGTRRR